MDTLKRKLPAASSGNEEVDRISKLPDELIHNILSFIDTKYAVQTSVLSKRWIYIWKSLPFLNFHRSSFSYDETKMFIDFVYKVLIFRDVTTDIHKFSVHWENSDLVNVFRWCLLADKYNVQEITIIIEQLHRSAYEIPCRLFNCKSLRKLVIKVLATASYVDITLPTSMNLPQLKVLYLYGLSISNVELLFSSCPVLETLNIHDCDIQTDNEKNSLIVDSLSLKEFKYSNCWRPVRQKNDTTANIIKLCAPNLQVFACKSLLKQVYCLENSSPLSEVSFCMFLSEKEEDEIVESYEELSSKKKDAYAKRMMKFLGAVDMVKAMRLSSGFLEVLSRAPELLDCQPLRLCNMQSLTLEMWSSRGCLRAIAYLLNISPHITSIFLESVKSNLVDDDCGDDVGDDWEDGVGDDWEDDVGDDWEAGLSFPGMLSHLKYVQFDEVEGCNAELKILGFVLKNALFLEEIVVYLRSNVGSPDRVRQVEQFKDKLRAVPRASLSIEIVFP